MREKQNPQISRITRIDLIRRSRRFNKCDKCDAFAFSEDKSRTRRRPCYTINLRHLCHLRIFFLPLY